MRIVHTCLRYPPARGGVETLVHKIVEATRNISEGRDVRVLTSSLATHRPAVALDPETLVDDPIYVQRLGVHETYGVAYPRLAGLRYYLKHHEPDIIHGHSFWYHSADAAARVALKLDKPFVLSPYFYSNEIREKPLWRAYAATIGRRTVAAARAVVFISPFEQKLMTEAGLPTQNTHIIPPGIDTARYARRRDYDFYKSISDGSPRLLSIGRLSEGKGFQEVLGVLPKLSEGFPDVQYVVLGSDFGYKDQLLELAARLKVSDRFHIIENASEDQKIAALQQADVFVHPSHYEAFGIVLTEAMATKTPIVARRVAAIPYVLKDGQAGLLFDTTDELVDHISTALSDSSAVAGYILAAASRVRDKFDVSGMVRSYIDLYEELR